MAFNFGPVESGAHPILTFIRQVGVVSAIALGALLLTWYQMDAQGKSIKKIQDDMAEAKVAMATTTAATAASQQAMARDVAISKRINRHTCVATATLAKLPTAPCLED